MTDDMPSADDRRQTADDSRINPKSKIQNPKSEDPFDRLYFEWARHALSKRLNPPSRERWDAIILRLILSEDPARVRRYKWIESTLPEGLGADAYELWRKTPDYTPNLSVPLKSVPELEAYELAHRASMRSLMDSQGQGERYNAILSKYEQYLIERKARIRRGQTRVLVMGFAGIGFILVMMLSVLVIILLKLAP